MIRWIKRFKSSVTAYHPRPLLKNVPLSLSFLFNALNKYKYAAQTNPHCYLHSDRGHPCLYESSKYTCRASQCGDHRGRDIRGPYSFCARSQSYASSINPSTGSGRRLYPAPAFFVLPKQRQNWTHPSLSPCKRWEYCNTGHIRTCKRRRI